MGVPPWEVRTEQTTWVTHLRTRRDSYLVLHRDISVCRRRLHDGEADLQRRQTPAAAVQYGFAVHQCIIQLVEFRGVGAPGLVERHLCRSRITIDVDTGR